MEIRANYTLVGLFTLFAMAGILITISWLNKDQKDSNQNQFDINFVESVRGLNTGSPVFFSGIRVGQVDNIKISDTEPGAVRVRISLNADTPVRENSEASLELMGLTGGSLISISGGTVESPVLEHRPDVVRVINAKRSPFNAVLSEVPNTIANANHLLSHMEELLTQENRENVKVILSSFATVASMLAGQTQNIESILNDSTATMSELRTLMQNISNTSSRIDKLVGKTSPEMERLASEGFPQVKTLVIQAKELLNKLSHISEKFDNNPKQYLFGEPTRQYKP